MEVLLFLIVWCVVCIYLYIFSIILGMVSLFLLVYGFYVYCGVVFKECLIVVDQFLYLINFIIWEFLGCFDFLFFFWDYFSDFNDTFL